MKKFQFLTAAGVALVLASCSSDTPDYNPQPGPAENTGDMYITLNLGMASDSTRADDESNNGTDDYGTAGEATINSVYLRFFNGTRHLFDAPFTTPGITNGEGFKQGDDNQNMSDFSEGFVQIKVDQVLFETLTNVESITVYAFANTTNHDETASLSYTEDELKTYGNAGNAVMTALQTFSVNSYNAEAKDASGNAVGTINNPWDMIDGDDYIKLERIAAKMYFNPTDSWNTFDGQDLEVEYEGDFIENINDNVYLMRHYSTSSYTEPQLLKNDSHNTVYEYPHAAFGEKQLASDTWFSGEHTKYILPMKAGDTSDWKTYTYVKFKYNLTAVKSGLAKAAFENGHNLFSFKGILIGDANDLKNCKVEDFEDELTANEINLLHSMYAYGVSKAGKEYSECGDATERNTFENNIFNQYKNYKLFKFDAQGEAGNYYYEMYYFKPVYNGNVNNYNIDRNVVYNTEVTKVSKIGYPGTIIPGPFDDFEDAYISVKFKVVPWKVVNNKYDLQ